MGEKVLERNIIGLALKHEQVSHYNPKDNRCYVKLSVSTADLATPLENYVKNDYLYDGQSRELLADTFVKDRTKTGFVFDSSMKTLMQEKNQSNTDFDAISELINSFVATERTQ